jgi:integrase/recombinase XerD
MGCHLLHRHRSISYSRVRALSQPGHATRFADEHAHDSAVSRREQHGAEGMGRSSSQDCDEASRASSATAFEEQIRALFKASQGNRWIARRDRALLLLLLRLGLRCEEVAHLKWQDIDWQAGSIRICSQKSRRERILPLPEDVGKALVAYLRTFSSVPLWIFDSSRSTFPDEMRRLHIKAISKYLFKRAGVVGGSAHSLRHTIATTMVNHGASFKDVSDLLGHRRLSTTLIYAKLDMKALAQVALPWPGGER